MGMQHPRGVFCAFQHGAKAHEAPGFIAQHRAIIGAIEQDGLALHPIQKTRQVIRIRHGIFHTPHLAPSIIHGFPHIHRECRAHLARILPRSLNTGLDGGIIRAIHH